MKRFNVLASALSPEDQTRRPPQAVCDYEELRYEWSYHLRRLEDYNRMNLSESEMGSAKRLADQVRAYISQCEELLDPTHSMGDLVKKLLELHKVSLTYEWTNTDDKAGRVRCSIGIAHPEASEDEWHDDLVQSPISQEGYDYFKRKFHNIERALRRKVRGKPLTKVDEGHIRDLPEFIRDATKLANGMPEGGFRKFSAEIMNH